MLYMQRIAPSGQQSNLCGVITIIRQREGEKTKEDGEWEGEGREALDNKKMSVPEKKVPVAASACPHLRIDTHTHSCIEIEIGTSEADK